MPDLLKAAAGSPLLLTALVLIGAAVWVVEKLAGADGPITRLYRAWRDRELRRIRRQQVVVRERRALDDARVAELADEVAWLRARLGEYEDAVGRSPQIRRAVPEPRGPVTAPIPGRARNSARPEVPTR
jgi:short subunit dehydrogenase-like uncharacterized protein